MQRLKEIRDQIGDEIVGGIKVKASWLKDQSQENYRIYLHAAFQRAETQRSLRQATVWERKQDLMFKVEELSKQLNKDYAKQSKILVNTCNPAMPDIVNEKHKLSKLSRGCSKKNLVRFFQIDTEHSEFLYYQKTDSENPKKRLGLDSAIVYVSSKSEGMPDDQWLEADSGFRVGIKLKKRKFQPIFYYTKSLHEAIIMKVTIESLLSQHSEEISKLILVINQVFRAQVVDRIHTRMVDLKINRIKTQTLFTCVQALSLNYQVETRERMIEWNSMLPLLQSEEPELLQSPPEKVLYVPKIWSTLRFGPVEVLSFPLVKTYSNSLRRLKRIAQIIKDRRRMRHPIISDMIQKKVAVKSFPLANGSYRVSDFVIQNMNKIGDIPFVIQDINQIHGVRFDGDNIILQDRLKHEFNIPIGEVSYIATNVGYKKQPDQSFHIHLKGRKLNLNVESMNDNILPQQIGMERFKQSRFNQKSILKISLKKLYLPQYERERLLKGIFNRKNVTLLKLKFQVGEFYYLTEAFQLGSINSINLQNDFCLDVHDAKYVKISLIAIKGRTVPYSLYPNEFVMEEELSHVSLRLRDFQDNEHSLDMMHRVGFNKHFYNTKKEEDGLLASPDTVKDQIVLTTAFTVLDVNGAHPSVEMEGLQLLVGRFVVYRKGLIAKVLKVNRNQTCTIEVVATQPSARNLQSMLINNVSLKSDINLIERYGISIFNMDSLPQNMQHGQFEWSLDLVVPPTHETQLLNKINEEIQKYQVKQLYHQKMFGINKKGQNKTFVCGKLYLSVLNALNIANTQKTPCDSFVQISIHDSKRQSNAKFIDIANEDSFILCKKNSEETVNKNLQTPVIKSNNNPSWVDSNNPQGACFDIGMFMKSYPHSILIEVYHQKKKSRFSSETENELIGFTELYTEDLIQIENFGQEFYLYLEDSINKSSIIKIRSLFVPSLGTIDRLRLSPQKSIFKNAQQFLFYKVLHMNGSYDEFGYSIPIGKYLVDFFLEENEDMNPTLYDYKSQHAFADQFQSRYEQFSPEHKRHLKLKQDNHLRPKVEENVYTFKQLWLFTQHQNRFIALNERQRLFWEEYMNDLMNSPYEEGLLEDELKSIRSKLTNTTKALSSKYKKKNRTRGGTTAGEGQTSARSDNLNKGSKFSVIFIGQWEKEESWKFVDIWYLVKFGIPTDLRVSLWKDLLRRSIHEQFEYSFYRKSYQFSELFNGNVSVYENLKMFANQMDSMFYQQIENDVKDFQFPETYLKNLGTRDERVEEERLSIYQIMKVFDMWATEFSKRRHKIIIYNKGMLVILQRLLSFMTEEDAFWTLIGIVKGFNHVYSFDFKVPIENNQHEFFSAFTTKRIAFKNEMTILNCVIKLHYPLIFDKLKTLGMPIEWYFYDQLTSFFAYSFSSDLVMRLWDMIVFNLSTNQIENRKRALWYLLAVPIYMIQMNFDLILKATDPTKVKELLHLRTPSLNYNPNLFIDELLSIIKRVFVIKNTVMNKIFKNDLANQLEAMRWDVEMEASRRFKDHIVQSKQIQNYVLEKGMHLYVSRMDLQKNPVQGNTDSYDVFVTIMGFRNIVSATEENEIMQFILILKGDETIESKIIEINAPRTKLQATLQLLEDQVVLQTRTMNGINKKLQVKLIHLQNGIHQILMGNGVIDLNQFISTKTEDYITLKLQDNRHHQNAYIDLKIRMIKKNAKQELALEVQGLDKLETDIYQKEKDEEFKKQNNFTAVNENIKKKILEKLIENEQEKQMRNETLDENLYFELFGIKKEVRTQTVRDKLLQLRKIVPHSEYLIQDLALEKALITEQTHTIMKFIIMGQKTYSLHTIMQIYTAFSQGNAMINLNDFIKIIYHMFQLSFYHIPINEVFNMAYYTQNKDTYSFICKVEQQTIPQAQVNILTKLVTGASGELLKYNHTEPFKNVINQVMRLAGIIHEIDMSIEPFNNINFWLKNNYIKRQQQLLVVTVKDENGNNQAFKFKFNSSGMFEPQPYYHTVLPLKLGGTALLSQEQFYKAFNSFPMITDFLRNELFLINQLQGNSELYQEASQNFKVSFVSVGRKFVFKFLTDFDKREDFTVDPSQMMRIAKGEISKIYERERDAEGHEYLNIKLSSLSRQDTFIRIKQRMKAILDFITQSENIPDVPNIMSEKFQFKNSQAGPGQSPYYHSMDRLMNVTEEKVRSFELMRVQQSEEEQEAAEKYDSYAIFQHSDNSHEWRPCKILMKVSKEAQKERYLVEFEHQKGQKYTYLRQDLLLSFDYKRTKDGYYQEEILEFLDKLDKEEVEIAGLFKQNDKMGMHGAGGIDDLMKQMEFEDMDGLRIRGKDMDDGNNQEDKQQDSYLEDSYYASS